MKNYKLKSLIIIIVLITIVSFLLKSTASINNKNVKIILSPYKNEYLQKELVWLNVKIINDSDQDYKMIGDFSYGGALDIEVKDGRGHNLRSPLMKDNHAQDDTVILKSGESAERDINLSWFMSSGDEVKDKYIINVSYNELKSKNIEIKVNEPTGSEIDMYNLANEYEIALMTNKIDDSLIEKIINMCNQNPQSNYAPQLYSNLLLNLMGNKKTAFYLREFEKFMNNYSNHPITSFILTTHRAYLVTSENYNKQQVSAKLIELTNKYPQSQNFNKIVNRFIKQNINYDKAWFIK